MTTPRVFVAFENIKGNIARIEGSDVNYLKNVMRLTCGDEIIVMDSKSKEYTSKISKIDKDSITAELISERHPKSEPKVKITVAQGLPKNKKMDLIVQKVTELGATRIIPICAERSIVRIADEKGSHKVKRWQRIAKEAAEQSGRLIIPLVDEIKTMKELLIMCDDFDLCVILWEMEKERTIKSVLKANPEAHEILVLIGPEGGFSHDEVESARKGGFVTATVGNRILRTETAAIAVLSMIEYEFEIK